MSRPLAPWVEALAARSIALEAQQHALARGASHLVTALVTTWRARLCTVTSHTAAKVARPSTLLYHSLQLAEDGTVDAVWLSCPICGSHLGVTPDEWIKSAVHPPRLELVPAVSR